MVAILEIRLTKGTLLYEFFRRGIFTKKKI